jgi:hypothetical protein
MGTAAAGLAVVGLIAGAQQSRTAGKIATRESKVKSKQIELESVQRESDRKERLADALASQIASSGSRNISSFEGSPLTILNEDIRREKQASGRQIFASNLESFTTLQRSRIGEKQRRFKTATGLLQSGAQFASATQ